MNILKPQRALFLYVTIMTLALVVTIFFLDKDTPKTVFILFLVLYAGLLVYFWRQSKPLNPPIRIASIGEHRAGGQKPTVLSNFEAEAQSILRQISMEKGPQINEINYYSPYSRSMQHPTSLAELPTPINEYTQDSSLVGTYNSQIWREQFRLALDQFKANLESEISNEEVYTGALARLNLKKENANEAEMIVKSFLMDRAAHFCTHSIRVVNEINKILSRNFRLSLTKVESTNCSEIPMDELGRLLDYYFTNRALPSAYKNKSMSPSDFGSQPVLNMQRTMASRLDSDMQELRKYEQILKPMAYFPLQRFNPCLLVYILRLELPQETIKINSDNPRVGGYQDRESLNVVGWGKVQPVHCLLVQVDNWMSLASCPDFRTKNCLKICLVLLLVLIKKESSINHPVVRSLRRLLK